jgi:hypothetical protein
MRGLHVRCLIGGFVSLALFASLAGCVAGVGYDGGAAYDTGAVGYGVDFYEPYGYEYGGWRGGYRVGPPRRGGDRLPERRDPGTSHPYRPAAPSRSMPSIPSGAHGGHGGGHHGH